MTQLRILLIFSVVIMTGDNLASGGCCLMKTVSNAPEDLNGVYRFSRILETDPKCLQGCVYYRYRW